MNTAFAPTRILGTLGRFAIEAAMHEVDLPDHSLHALHFVRDPAEPAPRSMYLRAIELPDRYTYVFDLRHLAPSLRHDMPPALERDRPGLVKYTLRPLYRSAPELQRAVIGAYRAFGRTDQQLAHSAAQAPARAA